MNRFVSWSHASLLLLALIPACGGDDSGGTGSTAQLIATCKKTCSKEKECFGAEANFLDCDQMCSPDKLQKSTSPGSSPKVTCDYAKLRPKFEACLSVQCSELDSCLTEASSGCDGSSGSGDMSAGMPSSGQTTSPGKTTLPGVPPPGAGTPPSGSTPPDDSTPPSGSMPPSGSTPGAPKPPSGSTPPGVPGDDAGAGGGPSVPPSGSGSSAGDCSICTHANTCCLGLMKLAGGDPSECDSITAAECEALPADQQSAFVDVCMQTLEGGSAAGISECM